MNAIHGIMHQYDKINPIKYTLYIPVTYILQFRLISWRLFQGGMSYLG